AANHHTRTALVARTFCPPSPHPRCASPPAAPDGGAPHNPPPPRQKRRRAAAARLIFRQRHAVDEHGQRPGSTRDLEGDRLGLAVLAAGELEPGAVRRGTKPPGPPPPPPAPAPPPPPRRTGPSPQSKL